jgi:hypothetical protein
MRRASEFGTVGEAKKERRAIYQVGKQVGEGGC